MKRGSFLLRSLSVPAAHSLFAVSLLQIISATNSDITDGRLVYLNISDAPTQELLGKIFSHSG